MQLAKLSALRLQEAQAARRAPGEANTVPSLQALAASRIVQYLETACHNARSTASVSVEEAKRDAVIAATLLNTGALGEYPDAFVDSVMSGSSLPSLSPLWHYSVLKAGLRLHSVTAFSLARHPRIAPLLAEVTPAAFPGLQELDVSGAHVHDGATFAAAVLAMSQQLTVLKAAGTQGITQALLPGLRACCKLRHLCLASTSSTLVASDSPAPAAGSADGWSTVTRRHQRFARTPAQPEHSAPIVSPPSHFPAFQRGGSRGSRGSWRDDTPPQPSLGSRSGSWRETAPAPAAATGAAGDTAGPLQLPVQALPSSLEHLDISGLSVHPDLARCLVPSLTTQCPALTHLVVDNVPTLQPVAVQHAWIEPHGLVGGLVSGAGALQTLHLAGLQWAPAVQLSLLQCTTLHLQELNLTMQPHAAGHVESLLHWADLASLGSQGGLPHLRRAALQVAAPVSPHGRQDVTGVLLGMLVQALPQVEHFQLEIVPLAVPSLAGMAQAAVHIGMPPEAPLPHTAATHIDVRCAGDTSLDIGPIIAICANLQSLAARAPAVGMTLWHSSAPPAELARLWSAESTQPPPGSDEAHIEGQAASAWLQEAPVSGVSDLVVHGQSLSFSASVLLAALPCLASLTIRGNTASSGTLAGVQALEHNVRLAEAASASLHQFLSLPLPCTAIPFAAFLAASQTGADTWEGSVLGAGHDAGGAESDTDSDEDEDAACDRATAQAVRQLSSCQKFLSLLEGRQVAGRTLSRVTLEQCTLHLPFVADVIALVHATSMDACSLAFLASDDGEHGTVHDVAHGEGTQPSIEVAVPSRGGLLSLRACGAARGDGTCLWRACLRCTQLGWGVRCAVPCSKGSNMKVSSAPLDSSNGSGTAWAHVPAWGGVQHGVVHSALGSRLHGAASIAASTTALQAWVPWAQDMPVLHQAHHQGLGCEDCAGVSL